VLNIVILDGWTASSSFAIAITVICDLLPLEHSARLCLRANLVEENMGCCGDREKQEEGTPEQKWNYFVR